MGVKDEQIVVAEESLRLCFSLIPSSCGEETIHRWIQHEDSQGLCGRGLLAAQDIKAGMPIFEEAPLILARDYLWCWRAWGMLVGKSRKDQPNGPWRRAFTAFQDLGMVEVPDTHVCEVAASIASKEAGGEPSAEAVQRVQDVLMRFTCNQFGLPEGIVGLYAYTSRVNHSCAPSMGVALKADVHTVRMGTTG